MAIDVTTLSVKVESKGIDAATASLDALGTQAERTEKAVGKLTEKMANSSASIAAIKASMDQMRGVMQKSFPTDGATALNKALSELASTLKTIKGKNISVDIAGVGREAEVATKGVASLNRSLMEGHNVFQVVGKSLYQLRNLLGGTMLAGAMISAGQAVTEMADSWVLARARLEIFLGSAEMAAAAQQKLFNVSQELKVPVKDITTLYTRLVPAMAEYGYNTESAMNVTKAMAAALKVSGATVAETSSVLLQFSQAMAAGRLNGAEFNAVAEGAPVVLRMLSEELGVSRGALKKMAADGMLPTAIIANTLSQNLEKLTEQSKKIPLTVGVAFDQLSSSFAKFVDEINQTFGITEKLASLIKLLADNVKLLGTVVLAGVAAWATYTGVLALYNSLIIGSTAMTTSLAGSLGLVTVGATSAAGATTLFGSALNLLLRHPVAIILAAIAAGVVAVGMAFSKTGDEAEKAGKAIQDALEKDDYATAIKLQETRVESLSTKYSNLTYELNRLEKQRQQASSLGANTEGIKTTIEHLKKLAGETKKSFEEAEKALISMKNQLKMEDIKQNSGKIDEYIEKMEQELKLGHQMSKAEELLTNAQKNRAQVGANASAANIEILDAEVAKAEKALEVEKRHKAMIESNRAGRKEMESAAKKAENAYLAALQASADYIYNLEEELGLKRKLTEEEKQRNKFLQQAAEFKAKTGRNNQELIDNAKKIEQLGLQKQAVKELNELADKASADRIEKFQTERQIADSYFNDMIGAQEKLYSLNKELTDTPTSVLETQLHQVENDKQRILFLQEQIKLTATQIEAEIVLANLRGSEEDKERAKKAQEALENILKGYANQITTLKQKLELEEAITDAMYKQSKVNLLSIGRTPGEILAEGFGEAGAAISKMTESYETFGKQSKQINAELAAQQKYLSEKGYGAGSKEMLAAEEAAADKRIQINSAMFASMAGAAKGFFSENSKGYKILATAEKAFRAVELAMAVKNFVAKMTMTTTETAAVVAGEGTKLAVKETSTLASIALSMQAAAANAVEAVTGAFVGVGPTGFVTGAAMLAVMAGLGFALSGGGGSSSQSSGERQSSQGAGSVFGDSAAKSESVTKALENISENSDISLKYNEGMLSALKNIESALVGVTKLVVRSGVQGKLGFAEGMGTTNTSGFNKLFNFANNTTASIGDVVGNLMFKPLVAIGNALFSVKKSVVDSGFIQNAQSFADVLSGGLDVMGYTDIETKKKKFGKTKTSTETNLSSLDEELQTQLSNLVLGMGDAVKEAASILKMDGDSFTNTLNSFVVDLGRISIQGMDAKQIQETLTNVFSKMGDDMAKAVMPGLDKFQEVGEGYLQTLIRVSSTVATVDGLFDSIGQTMNVTGIAGIEAKMSLVELAGGLSELSSKMQSFYDNFYTGQEKAANKTRLVTEEFKRLGIQMIDLNAEDARIKFRDIVNYYKDTDVAVYNSLLNIQDIVNDLVPAFDEASEAVETLAQKLEKLHSAANDSLSALEKSINAEKTALKKTLDDKVSALKDQKEAENQSYAASKSALEEQLAAQTSAYDAQISMYNSQVDAAKDASSAMKTLFADIESAIATLTGTQSQLAAQSYGAAKAQLDTALMLAKATGILPNPETFKATLDAVSNVDASKFSSLFDFQREQLQTAGKLSQLNSVVGGKITQQDATIVAIEASIVALESVKVSAENAAQVALADLEKKHKETIAKIDEQITALEDQYEADVFYLDGLLENAREQLAKADGTWQATKSVHDALVDFNTNLMAYIDAKTSSADQIVAMDVKTASLSDQANTSDSDAAAELKLLREELAAQNRAIAQNTLATAKILSNWDGDGQPETRVVA